MKYDAKTAHVTLSSGRSFYAWGGDLHPEWDGDWHLLYGSDGGVGESAPGNFTPEERNEIADYFISLWQSWRDAEPPQVDLL